MSKLVFIRQDEQVELFGKHYTTPYQPMANIRYMRMKHLDLFSQWCTIGPLGDVIDLIKDFRLISILNKQRNELLFPAKVAT